MKKSKNILELVKENFKHVRNLIFGIPEIQELRKKLNAINFTKATDLSAEEIKEITSSKVDASRNGDEENLKSPIVKPKI